MCYNFISCSLSIARSIYFLLLGECLGWESVCPLQSKSGIPNPFICGFILSLSPSSYPTGRRAKTKEKHVGVVYELNPEVDTSLLLILHWLELSQMTTSNYKRGLEMYSFCVLRKKKNAILVNCKQSLLYQGKIYLQN